MREISAHARWILQRMRGAFVLRVREPGARARTLIQSCPVRMKTVIEEKCACVKSFHARARTFLQCARATDSTRPRVFCCVCVMWI